MAVISKKTFFNDQSSTSVSETLLNMNTGSSLTLETTGTATSLQLTVEGIVGDYNDEDWTTLGVINMTDFDVTDDITSMGIFSVSCDCVVRIRVTINAISGGNVTVVGKLNS